MSACLEDLQRGYMTRTDRFTSDPSSSLAIWALIALIPLPNSTLHDPGEKMGSVIGKAILVCTTSTRTKEEILSRNSFPGCLIPVVECMFTVKIHSVRSPSIAPPATISAYISTRSLVGKGGNQAKSVRYSCSVDVVIGRLD